MEMVCATSRVLDMARGEGLIHGGRPNAGREGISMVGLWL